MGQGIGDLDSGLTIHRHTDLLRQRCGGEVLGCDGGQAEAEEREELHGVCDVIPGSHKNEESGDMRRGR